MILKIILFALTGNIKLIKKIRWILKPIKTKFFVVRKLSKNIRFFGAFKRFAFGASQSKLTKNKVFENFQFSIRQNYRFWQFFVPSKSMISWHSKFIISMLRMRCIREPRILRVRGLQKFEEFLRKCDSPRKSVKISNFNSKNQRFLYALILGVIENNVFDIINNCVCKFLFPQLKKKRSFLGSKTYGIWKFLISDVWETNSGMAQTWRFRKMKFS